MTYEIGQKVTYCPSHGKQENGIVKSISDNPNIVFVVFKCNGEWSNFKNYTGCATNIKDLKSGWHANS